MGNSFKRLILSISLFCLTCTGICYCGDLDDGISSYTEGSIAEEDELGQSDPNIKYIIENARAKGSMNGSADYNEDSIVIGPGATVYGDVVNITGDSGSNIDSEKDNKNDEFKDSGEKANERKLPRHLLKFIRNASERNNSN